MADLERLADLVAARVYAYLKKADGRDERNHSLRLCAQDTKLPTNCFALVGRDKFRLNISVALALEYEDVLKREDLVPGLHGIRTRR